jgi:elongation factor G
MIAYRETITKAAHGVGKLIKQSGGRGQYGHVEVDVRPAERGKGLAVENKIVGGTIPKEYIPAVKKGIEEAVLNGVLGGYPVIDLEVDIVFGSYHDVDSNELAFKMAAIFALKDAVKNAKPILLEPVMKVENITPDEYQGDIMGDLNRRRGRINSLESKLSLTTIAAEVRHRHSLPLEGALLLLHGAVALRAGARAGQERRARAEGLLITTPAQPR